MCYRNECLKHRNEIHNDLQCKKEGARDFCEHATTEVKKVNRPDVNKYTRLHQMNAKENKTIHVMKWIQRVTHMMKNDQKKE